MAHGGLHQTLYELITFSSSSWNLVITINSMLKMYVTSIYFETFKVEIFKLYSLCDRYLVPTLNNVH